MESLHEMAWGVTVNREGAGRLSIPTSIAQRSNKEPVLHTEKEWPGKKKAQPGQRAQAVRKVF